MNATLTLFNDLKARGLLKQITDPKLEQALNQGSLTVYAGFDPTSDSLHVGSLLPLLTLKRFQDAGHKVIAVMGGATGLIGDPSGKSQERSLITRDEVTRNIHGITPLVSKFLTLVGPQGAMILDNASWCAEISFLDFLRNVGKHFTINYMIAKDSVRTRLEDREHGISFTEFSYMLLQAYDFLYLYEKHHCRLQIGGSDQWGNITAGIELIRRKLSSKPGQEKLEDDVVFGLTHPLVTKADGTKFGKTETGNLWLDEKRTSAYAFYQFFLQTSDQDVGPFLRYFSFKSLEEIERLEKLTQSEPEKREAQRALAQELTELVHGKKALERAQRAAQALFSEEIKTLDEATLSEALSSAPQTKKKKSDLTQSQGLSIIDLLVESKLCQSKGAAKKDLASGGIYINNARASSEPASLKLQDLLANRFILFRKGKKNYHVFIFE